MKLWPFKFERKSLTSPTPEEEFLFTGGVAGSHVVSAATALTVPAVQSCIRLIAEAAASLDIRVEKKTGTNWEQDHDHPVAKLLADQPNEWSSTFELIRDLVATALTNDKGALAFVNRVSGEVREICRYEAAYYTVDYSADGRSEPAFRINNRPTAPSDVIFIRSPFSRSPLSLASEAIGAAKSMERHAANLFKNGARPGGVIETEKSMGDEAAKKMIAGWRKAHDGSENAGRTALLWDGASFKPMVMNSTDAQFLENRKYQSLEICRAFRVPPSMIYELDRATWSNSEQQGKEFLTFSLDPWLKILEAAMRRALFLAEERADHRIMFDRDDLTRADLNARATAISSLITTRVLNPNDGRAWLDLPPYTGGETFANPNTGASQPGTSSDGGPAKPEAPKPTEDPTDDA